MATVRTQVGNTYLKVTSTDYALIQNAGTSLMRVVFDTVAPLDDTTNYHTVGHNQSIEKCGGYPTGDAYVRMDMEGRTGFVSVSE